MLAPRREYHQQIGVGCRGAIVDIRVAEMSAGISFTSIGLVFFLSVAGSHKHLASCGCRRPPWSGVNVGFEVDFGFRGEVHAFGPAPLSSTRQYPYSKLFGVCR